jgi:hypothetical protein
MRSVYFNNGFLIGIFAGSKWMVIRWDDHGMTMASWIAFAQTLARALNLSAEPALFRHIMAQDAGHNHHLRCWKRSETEKRNGWLDIGLTMMNIEEN